MSATDTLQEVLTSDWQPATEIHARMEAAGFTIDEVRTARRKLGVSREAGGCAKRDGRWWLRLPPDGCPLCQRPWGSDWGWQDYWAASRQSSPAMAEDEPAVYHESEPSSSAWSPTQLARFEPAGPPRCDICGRTGAIERGNACPYWTGAQRCLGTMR
jgi:hypothetical protein